MALLIFALGRVKVETTNRRHFRKHAMSCRMHQTRVADMFRTSRPAAAVCLLLVPAVALTCHRIHAVSCVPWRFSH